MPEEKWTPATVKARLQEFIKAIETGEHIEVSEQEIRELQHFFNERSTPFLKQAIQELRMREYRKRHPRYRPLLI